MKVLAALVVFVVAAANARPNSVEEGQWHKSTPVDLSKYRPPNVSYNPDKKLPWKKAPEPPVVSSSVSKYKQDAECGIMNKADKIVNGMVAGPHQFPWQAAIHIDGNFFCGGSLITKRHVLTAGHCANGRQYEVTLGTNRLQNPDTGAITVTSTTVHRHESFEPNYLFNDIAIITLPHEVELTDNIRLACLPDKDDEGTLVNEKTITSGWGKTSDGSGSISNILMYIKDRPVITTQQCSAVFFTVDERQICIDTSGGHSPCNGDSGGPLVYHNSNDAANKYTQIGLVSFGQQFCEMGSPAVFTRISEFMDWIERIISL